MHSKQIQINHIEIQTRDPFATSTIFSELIHKFLKKEAFI